MEISRRGLGMFAASAGFVRFEPPSARAPVGLVLSHEQFPTARLLEFARQAEDAGFPHVWASDHQQPWQDNQGHSMFPWLTLALVGERTRRVGFGSGVTCPSYRHHPSEVAQAFASLELLAPGRTFLGLGTGESVNEPVLLHGPAQAVRPPGAATAGAGAALDPALRTAGKNPDTMPKWAELFAVAGDQRETDLAARRWRFTVQPADLPNPVAIQEAAQATPLAKVASRWAVGPDPEVHVAAVRKLLDAGVTPFLHFPQEDPGAAVEFYRARVLPRI
ncbi:hypothetical protein GCM10027445_59640 [Amycolatopsis endophytica]|uniref:Alkanesulfonate monooxygenase SsuD/methylene tetrahydromethanopterin reductase-like flavin-dependent oxidoreductase (Luciferase family) n=1 Tax=Amycolatopsis endophytica TaxID=860233 RepID=A0A853AY25_9PSEU|nr:LLM class flavin-dependent oxidoreductase [Amycolatopsis endophytica]NYI87547.1 alkanesulfonate monooxygenase SsuD/methylene tetrahydromethanopterin reductase-like flavin-dependent oxidoreductase (luciferase family) [Amycolatopsis endophytica]